ncbi:Nramp family divalent metal transporter [Microcella sp.]|uniref:Nramp family divalent metal transporter n=1 Tax=Microcella sp. TaxID=1913979 RepID=UPI00256D0B11|nr:Nramp family divalent metal transporter [Microcella sp.]MBX9470393.1 Nramp family divalent metal transporter [Microcella sp.]
MTRLIRGETPEAPRGRQRWGWFAPGLLWMISSVGSGSVLFTPRIGAQYGYELLWVAVIVVALMWVMIREVGRYTVVTGRSILEGFSELPGPRGWAIWAVFLPGIVAGVAVIAGVAALAASALIIALPGSITLYGSIILIVSSAIVLFGRYRTVESIAAAMSIVLILSVVITALVVGPDLSAFGAGLIPGLPSDPDWYFIMPWVGFILAGAGGILWYSYWVAARGFGGTVFDENTDQNTLTASSSDERLQGDERVERLRHWVRVMSATALAGVATGGVVIIAFLILGAELLKPEGIVPEGITVAEDLARLLGQVWGDIGFWVLIVSVIIALWGTVLSNQDGWPRTFADSVLVLTAGDTEDDADRGSLRARLRPLMHRAVLHRASVVVLVTIAPLIVLLVVEDPVAILSVGGIVTAALTPLLVVLTLTINVTHLPRSLQPGWVMRALMVVAALFFGAFAVVYFADLFGVALL